RPGPHVFGDVHRVLQSPGAGGTIRIRQRSDVDLRQNADGARRRVSAGPKSGGNSGYQNVGRDSAAPIPDRGRALRTDQVPTRQAAGERLQGEGAAGGDACRAGWIEVDPEEEPPVCQIMDYGEYRWRLQQIQKDRAHD